MALRPVSELGLTDLTDLASTDASAPARGRARPTRPRPSAKRPATTTGASPAKRATPAKRSATKSAPAPRASDAPSDGPSPRAKAPAGSRRRAVATRVALSVTYVAAGTAGVLLGRAAVRR